MMIKKIAALAVGLWLSAGAALAQTSPNLTFGQVLTPAQWNQLFINKQDTLGFTPINAGGGVMTGRLVTAPPSSTTAGLNLTPGSTPASPVNGDLWVTSSGIFAQINGATVNLTGAASTSFAGTSPITVSFPSGVVTYACPTCGVTGSPLSQFASTTSAQLAGIISNETGTGLLVFNNGAALTSPVITGPLALPSGTTATSMVLTTPSLGAANATTLAIGGAALGGNLLAVNGGVLSGSISAIGIITAQTSNASAFAVGPNGATSPAFNVDTSTASSTTGLNVKSNASGGRISLSALSSGTNEIIEFDAKGSGGIVIGSHSSGGVNLAAAGGGVVIAGCTLPGAAALCAAGNITTTTGFVGSTLLGGVATNSPLTVQTTPSASSSGDILGLFGSTVNIGNWRNNGSIINFGGNGGGVTLNFASAGDGLQAFNVFNSVGGKQIWIPGPGTGTTPGTIQFPAIGGTDTLAVLATSQTLSNKTLASPIITGTVSGSGIATAAQFFAGNASVLVPANVMYNVQTPITFGATTTFDFSTFINAGITLTGNITTMNVSNVKAGQAGSILFGQDATGGRTTVWNSIFKFAGGVTPVLSTAPNTFDVLFYSCNTPAFCPASLVQNVH